MYSFTKLKEDHYVFVSNFEIIQSNLLKIIFVWIMITMQWLPLILNGKSTDKALFYLYEGIYFICVIYFIWGLF